MRHFVQYRIRPATEVVRSATFWLLALHFAAVAVDFFAPRAADSLRMSPEAAFGRWQLYRPLTGVYFFGASVGAVCWLGLFLWTFGRALERLYGSLDFFTFYQCAGIFACLVWAISIVWGDIGRRPVSWHTSLMTTGAISGALALYALHYPTRVLRLGGFLPLPVWFLVVAYFVGDLALFSRTLFLPFPAHLGGVLFALLYRQFNLRFSSLVSWVELAPWRRRPEEDACVAIDTGPAAEEAKPPARAEDVQGQVDRILEKIGREGPESLTDEEREALQDASRRLRDERRRPPSE